jgi:hypothetical protein
MAKSSQMRRTYQLHMGAEPVGVIEANTAQEAVLDYLRSLGYHEEEIVRVGSDAASWRGAVYTAVPASDDVVDSPDAG